MPVAIETAQHDIIEVRIVHRKIRVSCFGVIYSSFDRPLVAAIGDESGDDDDPCLDELWINEMGRSESNEGSSPRRGSTSFGSPFHLY